MICFDKKGWEKRPSCQALSVSQPFLARKQKHGKHPELNLSTPLDLLVFEATPLLDMHL